MFINQPDIVLFKISSFLTVFEVQRLAWLSKVINTKISGHWIWKNLLRYDAPEYEAVPPMYAKRLLLSLNGVTLPINEYKVEFYFELENFGKGIASGGPCNIKEGTTFNYEENIHLFDRKPDPFKQAIDIADGIYKFTLKIYARYEGLIANIANVEICNWDEEHWRCQYGANAGDFKVDPWIIIEQSCDSDDIKTDHYDSNGVYAVAASTPWLEFTVDDSDSPDSAPEEELKFSKYLEVLTWKLYGSDSSEEDCISGSDSSQED